MSTTPNKSSSHRSSLGESTAEDMSQNNEMWRNELSLGKDTDADQDQDQDQEQQKELPVASSFKRLSDLVDVAIRIAIVLVFMWVKNLAI